MASSYRPPGRSNRSGRSHADNDVFEGLPVKQWNQSFSRVSLAPPVAESQNPEDQKWADPPMPRDYQLLNPWTQQLLRLARSGKVGTKRKQDDPDSIDEDKPEDEVPEEVSKNNVDERGYIAKKWRQVPEHQLEPEHKHFGFLAKRRRGMPSLYGPEVQNGANIAMRKTKVQRAGADGEIAVYEVLVPEGQVIEGEVTESTELADVKPVVAAPGTAIEGVGIANEEGVLVAEHLKPAVAPRRNRPPPKKKGGPGRGKKRVTFTNPDGSTYTTVVPNATKIVPQPGQTVKHVAKGEEASADVTAEEAAQHQTTQPEGEEGSGSDDGEDDGDDDDDREEGELSEDDAPGTGAATPAKPTTPAKTATPVPPVQRDEPEPMEDVKPTTPVETAEDVKVDESQAADATGEAEEATKEAEAEKTDAASAEPPAAESQSDDLPVEHATVPMEDVKTDDVEARDASSSPELPLAKTSHSRSGSMADPPPVSLDEHAPPPPVEPEGQEEAKANADEAEAKAEAGTEVHAEAEEPKATAAPSITETEKADDADDDLLGNLEKHLGGEKEGADA